MVTRDDNMNDDPYDAADEFKRMMAARQFQEYQRLEKQREFESFVLYGIVIHEITGDTCRPVTLRELYARYVWQS